MVNHTESTVWIPQSIVTNSFEEKKVDFPQQVSGSCIIPNIYMGNNKKQQFLR